jgi:hypothetical protein
VFFYLVVPVTVVYAARSLHAGAGAYAAILASWGVGIAIGSTIQIRLARPVGSTMILLSTGAVALGYLGTAVAPTIAVACAASVAGGIGNGTRASRRPSTGWWRSRFARAPPRYSRRWRRSPRGPASSSADC